MKIPSNKIKDVVRFFRDELTDVYSKDEIDVFIALCFDVFLKIKKHEIALMYEDTISESELLKFNFAVKDLKKHKPVQYILGTADFYKLKFTVNEHVLIPRPETEELVHMIIKDFNANPRLSERGAAILDIGTGSGCIAVALKKNIPEANVSAIDISEQALSTAKKNAESNDVEINFLHLDILEEIDLKQQFDVIVSNPPYITDSEKKQLHKNVLDYEPHLALFVSDKNPLVFYKAMINFSLKHLKPNGKIYFEINETLGNETSEILMKKGFKDVQVVKDLNGKNRILRGSL